MNLLRLVLLSVLCLAVFASSASAECAWVLWTATLQRGGKTWDIAQAVPSARECEAIVDAKMKQQKPADVIGTNMLRLKIEDSAVLLSFHCLPDTVDPRGPKGGGL